MAPAALDYRSMCRMKRKKSFEEKLVAEIFNKLSVKCVEQPLRSFLRKLSNLAKSLVKFQKRLLDDFRIFCETFFLEKKNAKLLKISKDL